MTDDAKELLRLHAKSPDHPFYARQETSWEEHQLHAAYAELVAAGFIEESETGYTAIGNTVYPNYRLTAKGYAAANSA